MKRPGNGLLNAITKTGGGEEALEWKREILKSTSANMDLMLGASVDVYYRI